MSIGVVSALKLSISVDEFEKQMTDMVQKNLTDAPYKDGKSFPHFITLLIFFQSVVYYYIYNWFKTKTTLGAERLLWHLNASKIPIALVTNSTDQAVQMHAKARPKLFGLFHHKVIFNALLL